MSERPKTEWRGFVFKGFPLLAVGFENLSFKLANEKIRQEQEVDDKLELSKRFVSIEVIKPIEDVYKISLGIFGKIIPINSPKHPEITVLKKYRSF